MIGFFTFFSSLYFAHPIFLSPIFIVFFYRLLRKEFNYDYRDFHLFYGVVFISLIVTTVSIIFEPISTLSRGSVLADFPYIWLILVTLVISKSINKLDLNVYTVLVCLEILVGIAEFLSGKQSFFVPMRGMAEFGHNGMLYYSRVFGLSENSSIFSFKILSVVVIYFTGAISSIVKKYLPVLLGIGLLITFNRTSIFSVSIFCAIYIYIYKRKYYMYIIPIFMLVFLNYFPVILEQMLRGKASDLSGRDRVFTYMLDFISNNPILGNSGSKIWMEYGGRLFHAHNSFLELFASNGIIISTLFLSLIIYYYRKVMLFFIPFFLFSLLQYGMFWGISHYDMIIFGTLTYCLKCRNERVKGNCNEN